MAVNLVRQINSPENAVTSSFPGDRRRTTASPASVWRKHYAAEINGLGLGNSTPGRIKHFIGGPVEPDLAFGLIELPEFKLEKDPEKAPSGLEIHPEVRKGLKKYHVRNGLFFAELGTILPIVKEYNLATTNQGAVGGPVLCIFWGYAAWNSSQLLAEIAKRHWGLSEACLDYQGWAQWDDVVADMCMAKESEYSKAG